VNGITSANYLPKEKPIYFKKFRVIFEGEKQFPVGDANKKVMADIIDKKYVSYPQLSEIYKENGVENLEIINSAITNGFIVFKQGYYFVSKKTGILIDRNYEEPEILVEMTKREKKAYSKRHPNVEVRAAILPVKKDANGDILYRVEFNQEQQAFHFDNGTHAENTFGWRTVAKEVSDRNIPTWNFFTEIRDIFGFKFTSVSQINEMYEQFVFCLAGRTENTKNGAVLTVDACIDYLKTQGFSGKLEKVQKTTFDL
jgi:hypothetical protein